MINLESIANNKNNKEHNENWSFIPDHPYRVLINGGAGSAKTSAFFNFTIQQDDIDKIYLYAKNLSEPKYEFLMKSHEDAGKKHLSDPNAFIECSNTMDDIYENIDDYHTSKKGKF